MDPMIERLSKLATSTLGHFVEEGFLDVAISPVFRPIKCAGRALTVGEHSSTRDAIRAAQPGEVMMVARGGEARYAGFGGMVALACKNAGFAGVVLDCPTCDYAEIVEFQLPVFSRGISALLPKGRDYRDPIRQPIVCGGIRVANGDYVLGDDDGILVIPPSQVEAIVVRGEAAEKRGIETRALLEAGKTLDEVNEIRRGHA